MKKILFFLSFLILGIVFFAKSVFDADLENILKIINSFSIWGLLALFAISITNSLILALRWKIIIETKSRKVSFKNIFWYRITGFTFSYTTPAAFVGGEPIRVYFLKENENMSLSEGTSSVLIDKILEITSFLAMISLGFYFALQNNIGFGHFLTLGFLLILLLSFLAIFFFSVVRGKRFFGFIFNLLRLDKIILLERIGRAIDKVETEMIYFFNKNTKRLLYCILLSFLGVSMMLLENFIVVYFAGIKMDFVQTVLFTAIPGLTFLIPIPGAIGAYELARTEVFKAFSLSAGIAFASSMIIRIRDLILVLFGIIYASKHGVRLFKKNGFLK